MKQIFLLIVCWSFANNLFAQRVAVNDDGSLPASCAALDIKSATKGFLWPSLNSTQRIFIGSPANGLMVYDNQVGLLHNYVSGTGWRSFINSDYWLGFTGTVYAPSADIGLGTGSPTEKLHLYSGNFKITSGDLSISRSSSSTLLQKIDFDYTGGAPNGFAQGIDFRTNSSSRNAYINFIASSSGDDDELRFYPSVSGTNLFNVFKNGEFRFSASDPTFQFRSNNLNLGFFQTAGNDLRLGTNSGNSIGRVVIRTNGSDNVVISEVNGESRMGIGLANPTQALDVNGHAEVENSLDINSKTTATNVEFGGKLIKPSLGSSALTPICYGSIYADGTIRSATPNVTVSLNQTGYYYIDCAGLDNTCMILVTPAEDRNLASGEVGTNRAYVSIFVDRSTAPPARSDSDFCFVIYKK